ncbi:SLC13 family permease [Oceanobacillus caeni]|uniref:SLC13 family permease n=1 Tax=Oceanobacillus TaxID=182709 RepID=UPI0006224E27|nr:SLC13 family permease [Oceanobacillus caeni]KKE79278.1 anion transporter [Bacilli bacterium VT-13-104]PZD86828.1 SLC13/DASS family transporter [Bacilli bacterium]MCR1833839.1 SLC13 family permease [Oceanobacillus caeni]PZD88202.1 SLC13/DASS family transporter [Bacilli bacterium]PZD91479.1 SLC13/DASS family transporter [Bacilli bacterium]
MVQKSIGAFWGWLWQSHENTKRLLTFSQLRNVEESQTSKGQKENGSSISGKGNKKGHNKKPAYKPAQKVGLILGPLLFLLTLLFFHPEGLSPEARSVLAVTLWVATWWITEPIPIPVSSLIPIILLPMTGALDGNTVVSSYGNDIIFLFLGGFFIATAMEKWNLHKRMALSIISIIGTSPQRIVLGFMVSTAFLSMWVSNTAATMMLIPMGLAIVQQASSSLKEGKYASDIPKFEKSVIFGIGYAATIGGLGTLIGTPPLSILAGTVSQMFDTEISFAGWMAVGVPIVILLIPLLWLYLTKVVYKINFRELPGGKEQIYKERKSLGKISYEEKAVAFVFAFAAFMWITRTFIWENIVEIPGISDGIIAMMATVLLFLIPAKREEGSKIMEWKDSKDIPWGILILFGGGLAIAAGFTSTGLSEWIGHQLAGLEGMNILLVIFISTLVILLLTEITSNTATATMIIPVVASLGLALNIHPYALMVPCAMAANCSFMLPVGTPPNAIMYGTGKLKITEMVKNGFWLNNFTLVLIVLVVYFYLPLVWGIDLFEIPAEFR